MKLAQAWLNGRSAGTNSSTFWPLPSVTARQCVCISNLPVTDLCMSQTVAVRPVRLVVWGEICFREGLPWQQQPLRKQISGVMTIETAEKIALLHVWKILHLF